MATRKPRIMYIPKYFMAVRKFTNTYHIPKYLCSSVNNINGRFTYVCIHYSSFVSYVMGHYYIPGKKKLRTE